MKAISLDFRIYPFVCSDTYIVACIHVKPSHSFWGFKLFAYMSPFINMEINVISLRVEVASIVWQALASVGRLIYTGRCSLARPLHGNSCSLLDKHLYFEAIICDFILQLTCILKVRSTSALHEICGNPV